MTPAEVKSLFRAYIDEPDATFVTDADLNTYLAAGYNEFRLRVNEYDPDFYAAQVIITPNNANFYDLADAANPVVLLGPAAIAAAMIRLNSVRRTDAAGTERGFILTAVNGLRALDANYQSWALIGTRLTFSERTSDTYQLSYVPISTVNWTTSTFIDSLSPFHDLIALYAYKQYAIRDNAINQAWQYQLSVREKDFRDYLSGFNYESNQYVSQDWYSFDNIY
jgi:hypothetical protein